MKRIIHILTTLICLIWLTSCSSVRYVPVETIRTEIRYEKSKDSTRIVDKVNVRDSVITRDSVVTIVNDKGDVIRTEIWHWKEKYSDVNALYKELQSKYDSLYVVKQDSVQIPYPVEKKLTWWQSVKIELGGWAFGGFIMLALVIFLWLVCRWRLK